MPRTQFTRMQLQKLEQRFVQQTFIQKDDRVNFARELGMSDRQVMVWFQNRR